MNWINKLDRKFGKHYIHNLMGIIIFGNVIVYALDYVFRIGISNYLFLSPQLVMAGQVWRLVTFIFVLPVGNVIFAAFAFYFYYMAGSALEREWGGFKFNIYYLFGVIATIVVIFITKFPYADASYVNLSLFLAFAKLYPDVEFLLFFFLPIKAKYLGYLNWFFIGAGVVNNIINFSIGGILLNIIPVVSYLIFFAGSNARNAKMRTSSVIRMKDYKKQINSVKKSYVHKCEVCGITDKDDPDMEFRYCSRCSGKFAYCEKHILNHQHK